MRNSAKEFLSSEDPLSEQAIEFLLDYQEEDSSVDYKLSFSDEEREWLEITKDIIALSNTYGGYLVFGIKDGTFDKIGLDAEMHQTIRDVNNLM